MANAFAPSEYLAGAHRDRVKTNRAERVESRRYLTFLVMVLGMFMAMLDIQIVSASLADIQAGIAANGNQISWVQTSYLTAEIVMIPLSGYLARALGTRLTFAISAAGFVAASFMCGASTSLNELIFWRAVQGFIGGAMIPSVFATAYLVFPASKLPIIMVLISLASTLAPTIGPTVGGYLTDTISWHWLFFVNIVPGIAVVIGSLALIDFDRPNFALLKRCDWWGVVFMSAFLGSLEFVLQEGPQNDWFNDDRILVLAWISGLSGIAFLARVLFFAREPIVDLRAFLHRNFSQGSLFSFAWGVGLFGLTYLYPIYLTQVRDYRPLMIGKTMFVSGLAMLAASPIVRQLVPRVDPRLLVMIGFALLSIGTWRMNDITTDWDFWELLWPQILRGAGLMLAIVPVNNIALGSLPPSGLKNAAALYILTRSLGGAVGIACITTLLNNRIDLHLARLHEGITDARQPVVEILNKLTVHFQAHGSDAGAMALKQLMLLTHRQGVVMGFGDVFWVLAVLFALLAGLSIAVRRLPALRSVPARTAGSSAEFS
jgi:DHA2 family multidrug resistance protein